MYMYVSVKVRKTEMIILQNVAATLIPIVHYFFLRVLNLKISLIYSALLSLTSIRL